jgi:hypothetical protein
MELIQHNDIGAAPADICRQPLRLSIGQVDSQFALEPSTLAAAVRKAAAEWNDATGQRWFQFADAGGIAVNLLFDGRQETLQQRSEEERTITGEVAELSRKQRELAGEAAALNARVSQWELKHRAYEERVSEYNSRVFDISQGGELSEEEAETIEGERHELAVLRGTLESARQELQQSQVDNVRKSEELQGEEIDVRNRIEDFQTRFPPIPFREAEHIAGGFINEINIYAVTDQQELHRALLHELGHAIGLEHSAEKGSIMAAEHEIGTGPTNLTADDIDAALRVCAGANRGAAEPMRSLID